MHACMWPALRRLSQENLELKASLGYIAVTCLTTSNSKDT